MSLFVPTGDDGMTLYHFNKPLNIWKFLNPAITTIVKTKAGWIGVEGEEMIYWDKRYGDWICIGTAHHLSCLNGNYFPECGYKESKDIMNKLKNI